MPRVLLLLPSATYRAGEFLAAASKLQLEIVTASDAPQAMATAMGDRFVRLDLSDAELAAEQIVQAHAATPFDAVIAVDDQGVLAASIASSRIGLPNNPARAVAATRDKSEMRRLLEAHGCPQPNFLALPADKGGPELFEEVASAAEQVGFPAVIKPSSLSGSRGVIRVEDRQGARAAAQRIAALCSQSAGVGAILVEAFVSGAEVALEGLLRKGALEVLALFDKPLPLDGPYFEETIYVTPSRLSEAQQARVSQAIERACQAIGLVEGPVHGEARITDSGEVLVIETAARTIGGKCAKALQFSTGSSLEEIVLRHALSLELAREARRLVAGASGVMMLPIARSGRLVEVAGRDSALAVSGITSLEISIPLGHEVQALPEGDRYLGFLFARGESPQAVVESLGLGFAALQITIEADARHAVLASR